MTNRLLATAVVLAGGVAFAQENPPRADDPKPPQPLLVGAKAPPLSIEKWIKGEPIEKLEPGKSYVVEFWATWCTPCRAGIQHLTELQTRYKDAGLTVIGVASPALNDQVDDVRKFVEELSEKMAYTVAWDLDGATVRAWHEASGQNAIPAAIVVAADGRIAWIGNPRYPEGEMDGVVEAVAAGRFDMASAIAKSRRDAENQQKARKILEDAGALWESGKKAEAMDRLEDAIALDPVRFADLAIHRFSVLLLDVKDAPAAYSYARKLGDGAFKDQPSLLASLAAIMLEDEVEKKNLPLAIKLAERALETSKAGRTEVLETLARAYFVGGDPSRAVEAQTRAIAAATDNDARAELQGTLEKYKKAAAKAAEKR